MSHKAHLERLRDIRRLKRERKKLRYLHEHLHSDTDTESEGSDTYAPSRNSIRRRMKRKKHEAASSNINMGNIAQVNNCWYTTCWFEDVPIEALVDTGAEASVISSRMLRQLGTKCHSTTIPSMTQFRGIGGNQRSLGTAYFCYTIGHKKMVTKMYIIDLPHIDLILGMDAFSEEALDARFNMSKGILQLADSEPIQLTKRGESQSCQVHLVKAIKLKAKTGRFVPCAPIYGDDWFKYLDHYLVEPLNHVFDRTGLLAGTAIHNNRSSSVMVYVMNSTERDVEISMGMPIARMSAVQEITSHESPQFMDMHNICMSSNVDSYLPPDELSQTLDGQVGVDEVPIIPKRHEEEPLDLLYQGVAQNLDGEECTGRPSVAPAVDPEVMLLDEHLRPVTQNIDITGNQLHKAVDLIKRYQDVFVAPDGKLGKTKACEGHRVVTGDTLPVRQRLRRVPPKRRKVIEDFVQDLLAQGCIKPSKSDWATPVVIVTKKDGSPRFCLDYRKLNAVTIKDAFPLPRIDDALDQLANRKYYCTLDLASGYYQLPMHPKDSHKTAFITHEGLYEWLVLPMGLANSPATFQRCMAQVLKGLIPDTCLAYLDDIIVFGDDYEETMKNLELVFDRLRQANLKLKPKKCRIFQSRVSYLGHIVSQNGIQTDPTKVEAIKDWPTPTDVKGVRSFLGIASYYRKFIPNFATIAHSLTRLTMKDVNFRWTAEEDTAFEELKNYLITSPILSYPRDDGKYIVDTDASNFGIGAVLSQIQDGHERVIAYASKSLSKSQSRYCTTKRELLAVVHFLGVTFRHYLLNENFTVRTDHSSLTWLRSFKDADGMLSRWLSILGQFDFDIQHRKGVLHLNADALSRRPPRRCPRLDCPDCYPDSDLQECNLISFINRGERQRRCETTNEEPLVSHDTRSIPLMAISPIKDPREGHIWDLVKLRRQQLLDPDIRAFMELLTEHPNAKPGLEVIRPLSQNVKLFWGMWDDFFIENDVLYRHPDQNCGINRFVVPLRLRRQVLVLLHNNPLA